MISPVKRALRPSVRSLDARLQKAIHLRFGLPSTLPREWTRIVRNADDAAAHLDAM